MQKLAEINDEIALARIGAAEPVLDRNEIEEIVQGKRGIDDGGADNVVAEIAAQCVDKRAFAGTDITGKKHKAPVVQYTVGQRRQGFFVLFPQPQESGICIDLKWRQFEAVVG